MAETLLSLFLPLSLLTTSAWGKKGAKKLRKAAYVWSDELLLHTRNTSHSDSSIVNSWTAAIAHLSINPEGDS